MRKKAEEPLVRMPVLGGVVIPQGKSVRPLLKGVYVLDEEGADQVQELFVDSAKFMGFRPPKDFKLSEGEIFYEGAGIAEVRLRGRLPLAKEKEPTEFPVMEKGEWVFPMTKYEEWAWRVRTWGVGRPDFSWVDDLRVAFSPRDLGRPYVAALRVGGPILLWWDVAAVKTSSTPAGADVRLIRVERPVKRSPPVARGDRVGFEEAIKYAEVLARSAEEMRTLLKLLKDGGELEFIDQYRAFGHAFGPLLRQRIEGGGAGRLSFSMKAMGEAEMRQGLLSAAAAVARDHLLIRAGRRHGSETRNRNPESKKRVGDRENDEERRKRVVGVIMNEYRSLCQEMPAAEAEGRITQEMVVAAANIPRTTFTDWLVRIDCCFEDLKVEALKRVKN